MSGLRLEFDEAVVGRAFGGRRRRRKATAKDAFGGEKVRTVVVMRDSSGSFGSIWRKVRARFRSGYDFREWWRRTGNGNSEMRRFFAAF